MQQIHLSQNKTVVLDDEDFARFSQYHWCYRPERGGAQGYAIRHVKVNGKRKTEYLHRAIMQPSDGYEVIFLDYDRLNCTRVNLRVATKEEARRHHRTRRDCPTGHKGISYNPRPGTWSVDIYRNGECKRVGTFYTQKEAIEAYEAAVRRFNPDLFSASGAEPSGAR